MPASLNEALARAVKRWPDRVFLAINGRRVTFTEFEDEIARLLTFGLADAGLRAGDRLIVVMDNSLACGETRFAANRLAAV